MTALQPAPERVKAPPPAVDVVQERLDEPVVLVPRKVWALLTAVLVAVAGTVTWLVAGTWPRHVDVTGVLVHGTGPAAVTATADGTVTALAVRPGSTVRAGSPLATVAGVVVRTPYAGIVVTVAVRSGASVRIGTPIVTLDRADARPTGYLLVTDRAELARLDIGQRVDFAVPGATVSGRITGVDPVPSDAAGLRARWGVPIAGLPRDGAPVRVVLVTLPRSAGIVLGATDATVTLPGVRPYQLVFGGGS